MCLNKPVEKMTFVYFLRCCSSLHSLSRKPESKPEAGTACSKHDQAGPATAQTARTYPARIGLSSGGPQQRSLNNSDEWASRQIKVVVQHARALRIATEQVTYLAHGVEIVQY